VAELSASITLNSSLSFCSSVSHGVTTCLVVVSDIQHQIPSSLREPDAVDGSIGIQTTMNPLEISYLYRLLLR
jgi:hypothetical protein